MPWKLTGSVKAKGSTSHYRYSGKRLNFDTGTGAAEFYAYLETLDAREVDIVRSAELRVQVAEKVQAPLLTEISCTDERTRISGHNSHPAFHDLEKVGMRKMTSFRRTNIERRHADALTLMICFSVIEIAGGLSVTKHLLDNGKLLHLAVGKTASCRDQFLVEYLIRGLVWGRAFFLEHPDSDRAFSMFVRFLEIALGVLADFDNGIEAVCQFKREAYYFISQLPDRQRTPEPKAYKIEEKIKHDLDQVGHIREVARMGLLELETASAASDTIKALRPDTVDALLRMVPESLKPIGVGKKEGHQKLEPKRKGTKRAIPADAVIKSSCVNRPPKGYPLLVLKSEFMRDGALIRKKSYLQIPHTQLGSMQSAAAESSILKWEKIAQDLVDRGATFFELEAIIRLAKKNIEGAQVSLFPDASKKLSLCISITRSNDYERNQYNRSMHVDESDGARWETLAREKVKALYDKGISIFEIPERVQAQLLAKRDSKKLLGRLVKRTSHYTLTIIHAQSDGKERRYAFNFEKYSLARAFQKKASKVKLSDLKAFLVQEKSKQESGVIPLSYALYARSGRLVIRVKPVFREMLLGHADAIGFYALYTKQDPITLNILGQAVVLSARFSHDLAIAKTLLHGLGRTLKTLLSDRSASKPLFLEYVMSGMQNLYQCKEGVAGGFLIEHRTALKAVTLSVSYLENVLDWLEKEASELRSSQILSPYGYAFVEAQEAIYRRILELRKFPVDTASNDALRARLRVARMRAQEGLAKWGLVFKRQVILFAHWDHAAFKGDEGTLLRELEGRLKALIKAARTHHPLGQIILSTPEDFLQYPITNIRAFEAMLKSVAESDPHCLIQLNARVVETVSGEVAKAARLKSIRAQYLKLKALNVGNEGAVAHYLAHAELALSGAGSELSSEPVYVISHQTVLAANTPAGVGAKTWRQSKKAPFAASLGEGVSESSETMHLKLPERYARVFEVLPEGVMRSDKKTVDGVPVVSETCLEHEMKARNGIHSVRNQQKAIFMVSSNGISPEAVANPCGEGGKAYGYSISNDLYHGAQVFAGSPDSREASVAYQVSLNSARLKLEPIKVQAGGDLRLHEAESFPKTQLARLEALMGKAPKVLSNLLTPKRRLESLAQTQSDKTEAEKPAKRVRTASPPNAGAGAAVNKTATPFWRLPQDRRDEYEARAEKWLASLPGIPKYDEALPWDSDIEM